MTDYSPIHQPTTAETDQAVLVQMEVLEVMARLNSEGFDWRVVLTGAGCAIADTVGRNAGEAEIPTWFACMSAMTLHFAK